jgi:rod shape-determining protein MreC
MRNFLNLLYKYHYLLLFFFLEGFSLFLIVQNNSFQRAKYIQFSSQLSGSVFSKISNFRSFFSLKETNRVLVQENIELKNKLATIRTVIREKRDTTIDTTYKQRYIYFSARVINNSVNKLYNYITLNKGAKDGVKPDMAVIAPTGIVGFVNGVSENFSTVLPVINKDFRVSGMFKSNKFFGSVSWPGYNPEICQLNEVPYHVKVQPGDTIVTTSSSSFPEGIPVGTVLDAEFKGGNFYNIRIKLATDFRGISYVTLVEDLMKAEQTELEKKGKHD